MSYVNEIHPAPPKTTPAPAQTSTPFVIAMAALAFGLVGYLALGMPGMDHSAAGDDYAMPAHMGHRLLDSTAFEGAVANPDVILINVDVPGSEAGLDGTDLEMASDQIDVARLPVDRSVPIAVYSRSGASSAKAVEQLLALGYTDISELEGGTDAWAASGRELAPTAGD